MQCRFFIWVMQAVPYKGTDVRNCFLPHVSFAKRNFKFRKVISCVYPAMWGEFKNFIQIIRTSVVDKIVGYIILHWSILLLEGNQFINLNSFPDIRCILSNFRQKSKHLFFIICIFFFVLTWKLGYQAGQTYSKYGWIRAFQRILGGFFCEISFFL